MQWMVHLSSIRLIFGTTPMRMYNYHIAGMNVSSDFKLRFASKTSPTDQIDVRIKSVNDVSSEDDITFQCHDAKASKTTIWFHGADDLRFAVQGGHTVFVAAAKHYNADDISLYINGSCMGAIAIQRGHVPLHISGVQLGNHMIAISGESGAGKSTMAALLATRGLAHFTDDVGVVDPAQDPLLVLPMPKGIKVASDVAQDLDVSVGVQVSEAFGLQKRYADDLPQSNADALEFGPLYIINTDDADDFAIHELKGGAKYTEIRKAIYREEWLGAFFTPQEIFALIINLAAKIPVYAFDRPRDLSRAIESATFLEQHARAHT
jgi:hypothetical protein